VTQFTVLKKKEGNQVLWKEGKGCKTKYERSDRWLNFNGPRLLDAPCIVKVKLSRYRP
jgi:hypothetical protein